jgi:UDP-N-acetyl-alpha-D-quinovosamine dehydrogenase
LRYALVTGANGFVSQALCKRLLADGWTVRASVRAHSPSRRLLPVGASPVEVGDIGPDTDWRSALAQIDVVFHLAARVHQMKDAAADPLAEYRRVNTAGTERLAEIAAAAGVRRLVFVSSVKVHGEERDVPYAEDDAPAPRDPYGTSKLEAEQALADVSRRTGLEVVVARPPLVYGEGVKANMASLFRAVRRGIPLPLGSIERNRRSLLYVGNLAHCLAACAIHPAASGRTYLVSDGEDVSTTALVRRIGAALGKAPRLLPVPGRALRLAGRLTGRRAAVERLLGSLAVDSTRVRTELGWAPPFDLTAGLDRTAAWFRNGEVM